MMKQASAILFDWDGTLIDSFSAGYRASIAVLRHYGIDIDRERFLETYSPNWYASYEMLGLPQSEWDNADRMWRTKYQQETSEPFPFTADLLKGLRASGKTLGLVTSGNRARVSRELAHHGFDASFAVVVCFEDTEQKKPHPAPLTCALEKLELHAQDSVYVGDRPEDIEMGNEVGAFTVGVTSEYGPRSLLEDVGADLILPDAGHLLELVT